MLQFVPYVFGIGHNTFIHMIRDLVKLPYVHFMGLLFCYTPLLMFEYVLVHLTSELAFCFKKKFFKMGSLIKLSDFFFFTDFFNLINSFK